MSLASELRGVRRISIDSSAFIRYVDGGEGEAALIKLFDLLTKSRLTAVASVTTIPEILVLAKREANSDDEAAHRRLLALCEVVPVTEEIAEEALLLRANFGLKTADAFHIATALCTGCDAIITYDAKDFGRVQNALLLPHAPERTLRVLVARNL